MGAPQPKFLDRNSDFVKTLIGNNSEKLARNSDLLKTLIGKYSEKLARNSNFVKTCNKPEKTGQN